MPFSTIPDTRNGYEIHDASGVKVATVYDMGGECAVYDHTHDQANGIYNPTLAYELGRALLLWAIAARRRARDAYRTEHNLPAGHIVQENA